MHTVHWVRREPCSRSAGLVYTASGERPAMHAEKPRLSSCTAEQRKSGLRLVKASRYPRWRKAPAATNPESESNNNPREGKMGNKKPPRTSRQVVPLFGACAPDAGVLGGQGAGLARLAALGLPVPSGV